MSDVKWIKITTNIFDDEKIKMIETLPEADSIIVIWFKILVMAGKVNDTGLVYFSRSIPYTDETLSTIMNRSLIVVKLAMKTFEKFGMIERDNDLISVMNWEKHQNIDGLEKIKEQNRLRQQKHRTKQISNVTSRDSNATDKKRIDKDKNKEDKQVWKDKYLDHVYLSADEYKSLLSVYPEKVIEHFIQSIDNYLTNNPKKKYTNFKKVIINWIKNDELRYNKSYTKQPTETITPTATTETKEYDDSMLD
jgi:predicted phage replisome organizer